MSTFANTTLAIASRSSVKVHFDGANIADPLQRRHALFPSRRATLRQHSFTTSISLSSGSASAMWSQCVNALWRAAKPYPRFADLFLSHSVTIVVSTIMLRKLCGCLSASLKNGYIQKSHAFCM